jgi:hypothetical protein
LHRGFAAIIAFNFPGASSFSRARPFPTDQCLR